ncbi:hypothetical protein PIB30_060736 [Stylosanthes scabra]|uniref:Uncharacterized protein n=1 Tax=Stylosanthes scabra TaxID=79078 RepID=A0ABU6RLR1_9FABA|nr:hypothetical protein [Stylosanthes scabra]
MDRQRTPSLSRYSHRNSRLRLGTDSLSSSSSQFLGESTMGGDERERRHDGDVAASAAMVDVFLPPPLHETQERRRRKREEKAMVAISLRQKSRNLLWLAGVGRR